MLKIINIIKKLFTSEYVDYFGYCHGIMTVKRLFEEDVVTKLMVLRIKQVDADIVISVTGTKEYQTEVDDMFQKACSTIKVLDWDLFQIEQE